jgi:hydrogenase nickel incorporation protein HypA/HybF
MHELSIAQAVVEQAVRLAADNNAQRVLRIELEVGTVSGVSVPALETAFPLAAEDTAAHGAQLVLHETPCRAHCRACGADWRPAIPLFVCERCGSDDADISGGRDLLIRKLEME